MSFARWSVWPGCWNTIGGGYKWMMSTNYLFYLYSLSRTIECETIKNHMHHAGSHEIQIPTQDAHKYDDHGVIESSKNGTRNRWVEKSKSNNISSQTRCMRVILLDCPYLVSSFDVPLLKICTNMIHGISRVSPYSQWHWLHAFLGTHRLYKSLFV